MREEPIADDPDTQIPPEQADFPSTPTPRPVT